MKKKLLISAFSMVFFLITFPLFSPCEETISLYPGKRGPVGYGIFQTMHYKYRIESPGINRENPYLLGAEFKFNWSEIEPREGEYRWDIIKKTIEPWITINKKVILLIGLAQKRGTDPTMRSATPEWVFTAGAKKIVLSTEHDGRMGVREGQKRIIDRRKKGKQERDSQTINFPIWWDDVFLEKYQNFVRAFAKEFDGHHGIEFIEISIGNFGTTRVAPLQLIEKYKQAGYTRDIWVKTIIKIIDIYDKEFVKTPKTLILSQFERLEDGTETTYIDKIAHYAAQKGIYLYNHQLTGNDLFLNNQYPHIFNKYSKLTKTITGSDNPIKGGRLGTIERAARYAIGGVDGIPKTNVSYCILYVPDASAATKGHLTFDENYLKAIKYIFENLRKEQK